MKIQLDTEKKTVKVLEDVELGKLIKALKKLLREDYNEFTLISYEYTSYIPWINPIIIEPWKPYTPPYYWYTATNSGVYNLELQETVGSIKS
jgi:hypothetical protein